jgi:hypothetical protein
MTVSCGLVRLLAISDTFADKMKYFWHIINFSFSLKSETKQVLSKFYGKKNNF